MGWEFFNFNFWCDSVLLILLFQGEFKGFKNLFPGVIFPSIDETLMKKDRLIQKFGL